ncbi:MAG: twin-arginine translocase TatA/TatE family subunit [Chloroflexi bacterium]|nr:twin-arginine translocase TatA/TatE family subunit [Chloroflexota bacterium]MBU1661506.1 twin-arginine translocase TatA/TatE family subunit [Chloroflexota bacterium]
MEFLGIGPLEVLFVLLIALIVFGPKDIVKAGQTMGQFLRKLVISPGWQAFQQTSRDLRNLPTKLMREAGLDEIQQDLKQISPISYQAELTTDIRKHLSQTQEGLSAWTTQTHTIGTSTKLPSPNVPLPAQPEAD